MMTLLTIGFHNFAAFVHKKNGLRVLIPEEGHTGRIRDSTGNELELCGQTIVLTSRGTPIDAPTERATGKYVVDLRQALPPFQLSENPRLLAEFRLGSGQVVEFPCQQTPELAEAIWEFSPQWEQMLTDYAVYATVLDSDERNALCVG